MRLARGLALAALLSGPSAFAGSITVGVGAGVTQDGVNASQNPLTTESVFARFGLTPRFAAELDIQKTNATDSSTDMRVVTGLLVLDLGSNQLGLVPQLFAGAGIDRSTTGYSGETDGHHFERARVSSIAPRGGSRSAHGFTSVSARSIRRRSCTTRRTGRCRAVVATSTLRRRRTMASSARSTCTPESASRA